MTFRFQVANLVDMIVETGAVDGLQPGQMVRVRVFDQMTGPDDQMARVDG